MSSRKPTAMAIVSAAFVVMSVVLLLPGSSRAATRVIPGGGPRAEFARAQSACPIIFPAGPVVVAPNQPQVADRSTVGIINALCDVTLNFIGCGFAPTQITIGCDSNGDGLPDISIPLKNITLVNPLLLQATIPALPLIPGTAFPLACCGGNAFITLTRMVSAGNDNAFGPFTQSITCTIDLGLRAPVVISATPSEGDCATGQNLLIPGACFVLPNGTAKVTSVFAVEAGNPGNVIHATAIHILTPNLIDAFFQIGAANAGKSFLIFASGPNGTSRNLSALPAGSPAGCPLGNEQGISVKFQCRATGLGGSPGQGSTSSTVVISSCAVNRDDSGALSLSIFGKGFRGGSTLTVGGVTPKKVKLKDRDPVDNTFKRITVKGRFCAGLPGGIVITSPDGIQSAPVVCAAQCLD